MEKQIAFVYNFPLLLAIDLQIEYHLLTTNKMAHLNIPHVYRSIV